MKDLILHLRAAMISTLVLAIVLCGFYPLVIWVIGQVAFKDQANGSLIRDTHGQIRGSRLLGQGFRSPSYFHSRPSAAGTGGYDAANSGAFNFGPTSKALAEQIQSRVAQYRLENGLEEHAIVPADAVTASGSGLDPHISVANAILQMPRVAKARGLSENSIIELICAHLDGVGFLGEVGMNVLELNLALDDL